VDSEAAHIKPIISAAIFPRSHTKVAKTFWQHSGDGISSRRADYCHKAFNDGRLTVQQAVMSPSKGPRRYQTKESVDLSPQCAHTKGLDGKDYIQFVEERFGRNLDVSLAYSAKLAIRRRIAGALVANVDLREALEISSPPTRTEQVEGFSERDVYLYPCGMSSIFNTHRALMACRGEMKSITFGYGSLMSCWLQG
jgi:cystathionine gamma-synthase